MEWCGLAQRLFRVSPAMPEDWRDIFFCLWNLSYHRAQLLLKLRNMTSIGYLRFLQPPISLFYEMKCLFFASTNLLNVYKLAEDAVRCMHVSMGNVIFNTVSTRDVTIFPTWGLYSEAIWSYFDMDCYSLYSDKNAHISVEPWEKGQGLVYGVARGYRPQLESDWPRHTVGGSLTGISKELH